MCEMSAAAAGLIHTYLFRSMSGRSGVLSQLTVLLVVSTLQSFSEGLGKQC